MKGNIRFRDIAVIALSLALAWGLRGQHGNERGAALAGAMAGLSLAAVTGGPRWIGAAVIGSLTFAIGGALSYGRFIQLAYEGSWEAVGALFLIGFSWGGLGSLGLGLGLTLSKYRPWERAVIAGGLLLVWFLVDRLLWGQIKGPQDLQTREMMAVILLVCWVFLCAYVGVWREDKTSLKLAVTGAVGFGVGFPLAAWMQGMGHATGIPFDWWKMGEHLIGFFGGTALALATRKAEPSWSHPLAVRPFERWLAVIWLLWLLPSWLIASNLDYWIVERGALPAIASKVVWGGLLLIFLWLSVWGWLEVRRGRTFATSWMPRHLRKIFLTFLWLTTLIGAGKTLAVGVITLTPLLFLLMAGVITFLLRSKSI